MKKLLLLSALICTTLIASAQQEETTTNPTDKGHFIVDGSVFFSIHNSKNGPDGFETKNNSFGLGISPKAAYFIIDQLAVGLEPTFNYASNEYTNSQGDKETQNSTAVSVGPFVRYYLSNGLFGQASVGFGTSKSTSDEYENKSDSFRYGLGVGYAIFLNQHISLEPIVTYLHTKTTNDQYAAESTNNGFTLGAGFTIYL